MIFGELGNDIGLNYVLLSRRKFGYVSIFRSPPEINLSKYVFLAFNASYKGSLTRIYYAKLYSLDHLIL